MNSAAGKVFISYRRSESTKDARAIYERLRREFGERRVFIDLEGIAPGEDFVDQLGRNLEGCEVFVALIGPGWADARTEQGERRLGDTDDFVRIEMRTALTRGIKVLPVLVDGARPLRADQLPEDLQPLVRRQAIALDYTRFEADVGRLVKAIRMEMSHRDQDEPIQGEDASPITTARVPYALGALIVAGGVGAFMVASSPTLTDIKPLPASTTATATATTTATATAPASTATPLGEGAQSHQATLAALKAANVTNSVGDSMLAEWLDEPERRYARLAEGCIRLLAHGRLSGEGADLDKINEFYAAAIGLKDGQAMPSTHAIDPVKLAKAVVEAYNDKNGRNYTTLSELMR